MSVVHVTSLDDPRLAPYRDLKRSNLTRHSGLFVVEGDKLVRRLLAKLQEKMTRVLDGPGE